LKNVVSLLFSRFGSKAALSIILDSAVARSDLGSFMAFIEPTPNCRKQAIATRISTMFETIPALLSVVLQQNAAIPPKAAAMIAVGLGALGTGIAQRSIGASAVGAVAEDDDMFVRALIFTALPETLIIIAFVTIFLS
jgi:V/A-type H+-transporting ATPase subunit K